MTITGKPPVSDIIPQGRPGAGAQSPGTAPEAKPPAQYSPAAEVKATKSGSKK